MSHSLLITDCEALRSLPTSSFGLLTSNTHMYLWCTGKLCISKQRNCICLGEKLNMSVVIRANQTRVARIWVSNSHVWKFLPLVLGFTCSVCIKNTTNCTLEWESECLPYKPDHHNQKISLRNTTYPSLKYRVLFVSSRSTLSVYMYMEGCLPSR